MDIWHAIQAVVASADYYTLGAAILVILIAGFLSEVRSVLAVTLVALLAFAVVKFVLALTVGGAKDVEVLATAFWKAFIAMPSLTLLAYLLVFGVLTGVVSGIKSAVR
jgi:hypothetical protein